MRFHRPIVVGCWLFASVMLSPRAAHAARGGDRVAGYEWLDTADGAVPYPAGFGAGVTTLTPADEAPPTRITLPWPFRFYGVDRLEAWVSDNGWLSFEDPLLDAHPLPGLLPDPGDPQAVLAPFWSDLVFLGGAQSIRHGIAISPDAHRIEIEATEEASGLPILVAIVLHEDGGINIHHPNGVRFNQATVGIENSAGTDGFSIVDRGTPVAGVSTSPMAGYTIQIVPPPLLRAECLLIAGMSCGATIESLPGTLPENITEYGCGVGGMDAREQIHSLTFTEPTRLQATIAPLTAGNVTLLLLDACDEDRCVAGPGANFDVLLAAGTYYLVVDAPSLVDEGTYALDTTCTPLATPWACGQSGAGLTTMGGGTLFDSYPCRAGRDLTGSEALFVVDLAGATNLRASLGALGADLDVLVLDATQAGVLGPDDCVAWDDSAAIAWNAGPGQHVIVVDGVAGVSGTFSLDVACTTLLDCTTLAGTIDLGAGPQVFAGDTTGAASVVSAYSCAALLDGPELVYELVLPAPGRVVIAETGAPTGLRFLVMAACNEGTCLGDAGDCDAVLPAGTYRLVVDGPAASAGPFSAHVLLETAFPRWDACMDPGPGVLPTDTARDSWSFDASEYCLMPGHRSWPDGCAFAMYVAVPCGNSLHFTVHDLESATIRAWDLLRQEPVNLMVRWSSGAFQSGPVISWADCTGTDPRFNNATVDFELDLPRPSCGVYRLEFENLGGFGWDLFANCDGSNTPGFTIHDDACGALQAYEPLPQLSLVSANVVANCPEITFTYTVENMGCVDATDVVVTYLHDGTALATDTVLLVPAGAQVTQSFMATFPGLDNAPAELAVDFENAIRECDEVPGSGCNVDGSVDMLSVLPCIVHGCVITIPANATPSTICPGEASTIDASGTTAQGCFGSMLFQLRSDLATLVPWQSSANFAGLEPFTTTTYFVDAWCLSPDPVGPDPCITSEAVTITIDPGCTDCAVAAVATSTPSIICRGETVTIDASGSMQANCPGGALEYQLLDGAVVIVPWQASATFGGLTPQLPTDYRIEVRCADAANAATCVDQTIASVDVVVDQPALLPLVGPSLRVGAPDVYSESVVPLRWSTDRPLSVLDGEHFHVLRSIRPDGGFTQINVPDPPLLGLAAHVDGAADFTGPLPQVWHYLVFTAAACHVDNSAFDR